MQDPFMRDLYDVMQDELRKPRILTPQPGASPLDTLKQKFQYGRNPLKFIRDRMQYNKDKRQRGFYRGLQEDMQQAGQLSQQQTTQMQPMQPMQPPAQQGNIRPPAQQRNVAQPRAFNLKKHKTAQMIMLNPQELHPNFLKEFQDDEDLFGFLESLTEQDLCIMKQHAQDPETLQKIYIRVTKDLNETAKQLAME
jgi:hypothetical protein